jgi:DNA-binding HxlR family transcriptional regulator
MPKEYGQDCPLAKTAEIVAERWTPLILRQLFAGRCHFSQFTEDLPGISPRLLAERLKTLEAHGVVERVALGGYPPRVEYRLTESGRALRLLALAMSEWGARHCAEARPMRLIHAGCGGAARLEVRCTRCDAPLEAAEVGLERRERERERERAP